MNEQDLINNDYACTASEWCDKECKRKKIYFKQNWFSGWVEVDNPATCHFQLITINPYLKLFEE